MMWLAFFKHLKQRSERSRLGQQLGLSTLNSKHMTADDGKLAAFAYHSHPDIFSRLLAEQPAIMSSSVTR